MKSGKHQCNTTWRSEHSTLNTAQSPEEVTDNIGADSNLGTRTPVFADTAER